MTDIGVHFDLRNPPQWLRPWDQIYAGALATAVGCEQAGFGSAWVSEHHLFEDGYLSQPVPFVAAMAARTARMRIGTSIMLAPLRSARQIAEDATVLDLVSGGRFTLGIGAGYRLPEFQAFGADHAARFQTTEDRAREVRRMWDEGAMIPPPVQARLPIFLGFGTPAGARRAGRLGEGLLSLDPSLYDAYCDGLAAAGYDRSRARMIGVVTAVLTDDPARDWPRIEPHATYHFESYRRYGAEGTGIVPKPLRPGVLREEGPDGTMPSFVVARPGDLAQMLRDRLAGLPIETVILSADYCGLPADIRARHLALAATRLLPAIANLPDLPRPAVPPPWQTLPGMRKKRL